MKVSLVKLVDYLSFIYDILLCQDRHINASPQQLVFTVKRASAKKNGIHFITELVQAQYLTKNHMLVDHNMNLIPIDSIHKIIMYKEEKIREKRLLFFKKSHKVITEFRVVDMYSIELGESHIFLLPALKISSDGSKDCNPPLILMHNGLPALAAGISFAFDSMPASITLAEATFSLGGLTMTLGSAGLALGITVASTCFLYNIFNKNKLHLENADQDAPSEDDQNNPPQDKDCDDDKEQAQEPKKKDCKYDDVTTGGSVPNRKTDVTKEEFEKNLVEDGWVRSKSKDGQIDNYVKDGSRYSVRGFSKSTDGPTAEYYMNGKRNPESKIRLR